MYMRGKSGAAMCWNDCTSMFMHAQPHKPRSSQKWSTPSLLSAALQPPHKEPSCAGSLPREQSFLNLSTVICTGSCLIGNADFISREDALETILPHMLDLEQEGPPGLGRIALVQTPQIFYNRNVLVRLITMDLQCAQQGRWRVYCSELG